MFRFLAQPDSSDAPVDDAEPRRASLVGDDDLWFEHVELLSLRRFEHVSTCRRYLEAKAETARLAMMVFLARMGLRLALAKLAVFAGLLLVVKANGRAITLSLVAPIFGLDTDDDAPCRFAVPPEADETPPIRGPGLGWSGEYMPLC